MNQGKLKMVKQEMARVNVYILCLKLPNKEIQLKLGKKIADILPKKMYR